MPNRGEIWLADLNPPRQSQALLGADHPSTFVITLTTKLVMELIGMED